MFEFMLSIISTGIILSFNIVVGLAFIFGVLYAIKLLRRK